jgi:hypothetical protein
MHVQKNALTLSMKTMFSIADHRATESCTSWSVAGGEVTTACTV